MIPFCLHAAIPVTDSIRANKSEIVSSASKLIFTGGAEAVETRIVSFVIDCAAAGVIFANFGHFVVSVLCCDFCVRMEATERVAPTSSCIDSQ